jgi:hypothetical protein
MVAPLTIFTKSLGDRKMTGDKDGDAILAKDVLDAVQTVVNVLSDGSGGRYVARFCADPGAATDLRSKQIIISSDPIRDQALTAAEAATVLTGLVCHEVGHTILTPALAAAIEDRWGEAKFPRRVGNIFDDRRLEAWLEDRYFGLRGVFDPTLDYMWQRTGEGKAPAVIDWADFVGQPVGGRLNFVTAATRYRRYNTFAPDAATQDELRFWETLFDSVNATTTADQMIGVIDAAMARLRVNAPKEQPTPPPPPGPVCQPPVEHPTQPPQPTDDTDDEPPTTEGGKQPGPKDPEGEPKDGEDGEPNGPGDDTEGEDGEPTDGDGDPEGSDGDGEDGDEDGGTEGDGDSDGDDADDTTDGGEDGDDGEGNPGGDEGPITDGDEDTEADPDTDNTGDAEHRPESAKDGKGGHGNQTSVVNDDEPTDPDDGFDEADVNEDVDDLNGNTYKDRALQDLIEVERTTVRVTAGEFGKMAVRFRF